MTIMPLKIVGAPLTLSKHASLKKTLKKCYAMSKSMAHLDVAEVNAERAQNMTMGMHTVMLSTPSGEEENRQREKV